MNFINTRSQLVWIFIALFAGTAGLSHAKPVAICSASVPPQTKALVARPMARVPVGLYYMQVYLIVSRYLKKTAWYFAPDGTVYADVTGGLTPADLARHKGWKGRARMVGKEMEIRWTNGSVYKTEFVPKSGGFDWATTESGMFLAVKSFANWQQMVGSYQGGTSSSSGGGFISTASTLTL